MNLEKYKKTGMFTLSSGHITEEYFDIKEAMGEPEILREMIRELDRKHNMENIDVIIGIEIGGIPLAVGLSQYTNVPFAILRKEKNDHGMMKRIEGYKIVGRVLLLDDVKTSGNSLKDATDYLKSKGYSTITTDVVLDRSRI